RALHAELPQLARRLGREAVGGVLTALGKLVGRARELGLELAQDTLVLGQDRFVAAQVLELARRVLAKRQHRRLRVAVLPLEAREDIEALVDRLEAAR